MSNSANVNDTLDNNNKNNIESCEEGSHSQLVEKLNDNSQVIGSAAPIRPVQIRSHEDGSSGYGSPDSVMSDSAK